MQAEVLRRLARDSEAGLLKKKVKKKVENSKSASQSLSRLRVLTLHLKTQKPAVQAEVLRRLARDSEAGLLKKKVKKKVEILNRRHNRFRT